MTQTQHTAGPWFADKPDMFGDVNILHSADALAVAAVVSNLRPEDEIAANARLIAAAPELLEAAQEHVLFMDGTGLETKHLNKLRAAIARATGAS